MCRYVCQTVTNNQQVAEKSVGHYWDHHRACFATLLSAESPFPVCVVFAACSGSPANPANGAFACSNTALPGTTCEARCDGGFMGPVFAICSASGTWQPTQGTCEHIGGSSSALAMPLPTVCGTQFHTAVLFGVATCLFLAASCVARALVLLHMCPVQFALAARSTRHAAHSAVAQPASLEQRATQRVTMGQPTLCLLCAAKMGRGRPQAKAHAQS